MSYKLIIIIMSYYNKRNSIGRRTLSQSVHSRSSLIRDLGIDLEDPIIDFDHTE